MKNFKILVISILALLLAGAGTSIMAQDSKHPGWELDSEYNQLYNPRERDSIRGDVVKLETVTPLPGMSPGVALILDEGGGEHIVVHVCPESFATAREIGLRRGDWVKIKGAWADIGDESVFIAAKIKKDGGYSFKVRLTSNGMPFWEMTPEQLAKEQASD